MNIHHSALERPTEQRLTSRPAIGEGERPSSDRLFGVYLRQMGRKPTLGPGEVATLARQIQEREIETWEQALLDPEARQQVLAIVCRELSPDLSAEIVKLARRPRYVAPRLREIDRDRQVLRGVISELGARVAAKRSGKKPPAAATAAAAPTRAEKVRLQACLARIQQSEARAAALRCRLAEANLRLVILLARRYMGHGLPLADLVQEGNAGLMKAVDRFDHDRQVRFSTYATWWIRHNISRALANNAQPVRRPVHVHQASQRVARVWRELSSRLGRAPTGDEMADASRLSGQRLDAVRLLQAGSSMSLDQPLDDDASRTRLDTFRSPESEQGGALDALARRQELSRVRSLLAVLNEREADVLRKRFGLEGDEREWTLEEIGQTYDLSRERVRQIQERALDKLRRELRACGDDLGA